MRLTLIAAPILLVCLVGPATADPNCKCRYYGERYDLGTVMCIKGKLSRCEMVLNNTSWKTLADACPQASAPLRPQIDGSGTTAAYRGAPQHVVAISR